VFGKSVENAGVVGESDKLHGVFGTCHNPNGGGVFGTNDVGGFGVIGVSDSGIGISGKGGKLAGQFEGNVDVSGKLNVLGAVGVNLDLNVNGTISTLGDVRIVGSGAAGLRDIAARVQSLETRLNTLQTQINNLNTLQTQINNLQAQLGNLQQKEVTDVLELAARVTALGG
jgi:hypothetical protein